MEKGRAVTKIVNLLHELLAISPRDTLNKRKRFISERLVSNSVEKWPGNQGKQRRKLSTLICVMIRYFAGETLGVIYGFYCRNQKASFCKW